MNTPHDPDFEALLKDYQAEFERYRQLPAAEPARELDIAIMAKAREAVAKPKRARARWLVPLASVASLALAAGIGWRAYQGERHEQMATVEQAAASKADEIVEFEWIDLPNRDAERKEMANSPPLPPPAAPAPAPAASAPPPPPPPPETIAKVLADAAQPEPTDTTSEMAMAPTRQAAAASPRAQAERDFAEPHVAADHADMAEPPESSKRALSLSGTVAPGANAAGASAPASEEALEQSREAKKPKKILEPEDWIERIRELRSYRRFHEVKKELAEFRKTYPNYPLPKDLENAAR